MDLEPGGMDIWYIDESSDSNTFAVSAIAIPFLRPKDGGGWQIVWDDHLAKARQFRKDLHKIHTIPTKPELHAVKLASGRGSYKQGKHQFSQKAGSAIYKWSLQQLSFLEPESIISVVGNRSSNLYGNTKLEAVMFALFQRMEQASLHNKRNGMVFFDEGHGEYRNLYRKSRKYLPTGSQYGAWMTAKGQRPTTNKPMSHFVKDANFKQSHHTLFIQLADLVVYGALMKVRQRTGNLTPWQQKYGLDSAYDGIPGRVVNKNASRRCHYGLGIVWL
jgi:hypothetical protein